MNMQRAPLPVSLVIGDYDRTRPLLNGQVKAAGVDLTCSTADIPEFCLTPIYEEYDVAEMSLSWYLMAHCREEPVVALPVFPLRMPVHAYLYCRTDSPFTSPRDLRGKRIGTKRYRSTINVWIRGILKDQYEIEPEDFSWITPAPEGAGFVVPRGVSVEVRPGDMSDIEELLFNGEIDAIFTPVVPDAVMRGDPRIRRLFPDCRAEARSYFKQVGFLPITHVMVMSKELWKREPWVAESVSSALDEAQSRSLAHTFADPKHLTFCETLFILEEEQAIYGRNAWANGVEANRAALEVFVRYCHEQGYIPRRPIIEDAFAANTLKLFESRSDYSEQVAA
jgi:4,5-dihydroxyphthalate decarboxylase